MFRGELQKLEVEVRKFSIAMAAIKPDAFCTAGFRYVQLLKNSFFCGTEGKMSISDLNISFIIDNSRDCNVRWEIKDRSPIDVFQQRQRPRWLILDSNKSSFPPQFCNSVRSFICPENEQPKQRRNQQGEDD